MELALLALTFAFFPSSQAQTPVSPLTPEEQRAGFFLPVGMEIDLVASDPAIQKVVDIAFDDSGRMWAVTAVEYPVDGNETPGAAELYEKEGRDRVLVFDTPCAREPQTPRVFAAGMVMPMSVLPISDGVLVAQGSKILMLRDRDRDGVADQREVVLDGFGIQDSHLMPHRMLRGPGEWIYVMQGAFNSSRVVTKSGEIIPFDQCKIGRFKADGSKFEVVGTGLNNIWGLVIDPRGEMWIQEANDLGFPVVPFSIGESYPGIGDHRAQPYAPWSVPLARFSMGGTGLSGLALSGDAGGFAAPFDGAMILANPIARSIQAVRATEADGLRELEKLPDVVTSSDEWFRPIAVHFGPDGCLYIVDWYNKIISHNEVPRDDPARDRTHGRIWRLRQNTQVFSAIPDVAGAPDSALSEHLCASSTWEARAAWHQIVDRRAAVAVPRLAELMREENVLTPTRLLALWSLEGLGLANQAVDAELLADKDPAIRREAARALGEAALDGATLASMLAPLAQERDQSVRLAAIRALGRVGEDNEAVAALLLAFVRTAPTVTPSATASRENTQSEQLRYQREFERSQIREGLERQRVSLAALLSSAEGTALSPETRALAALALTPAAAASVLAEALSKLTRAPSQEEVALLAGGVDDPGARACLDGLLADESKREGVLEHLWALRARLNAVDLSASLEASVRARLTLADDEAGRDLCVRITSAFRVRALEPEVVAIARSATTVARRTACMRALAEIGSGDLELFIELAEGAMPGGELQRACVVALAESKDGRAIDALVQLWPVLAPDLRRRAMEAVTATPDGAESLLAAIAADEILPAELDGEVLTRLSQRFTGDPRLARLEQVLAARLQTVLRLAGGDSALLKKLALPAAFTLETWIKLDEGIDNQDALLGARGATDFNFSDRRLRMYAGKDLGDVIVSSKQIEAGAWTHVAITRDAEGHLHLYWNGDLDSVASKASKPAKVELKDLDVGVAVAEGGTRAALVEMRLWSVARTAAEIGANFRRTLVGSKPANLVFLGSGAESWGELSGAAAMVREFDVPNLLTASAALEIEAEFARVRALAKLRADSSRGRDLFASTCLTCHSLNSPVGTEGGKLGPALDGIGLRDQESLLRALLTPSAAVESGYRLFRVETSDGELLEGLLASKDERGIVLRRQDREDLQLERSEIRRMWFTERSVMPDGQIEALTPADVSALFAYIATLR